MSEHESANKLSSQTTPTWEVELLISGIAVFAMFQLAGSLDDGIFALAPRLDANWQQLAVVLYFYLKSAAVILAVTFASHLLLRAKWIALVGMHSVYPDGVQWHKLRMGPIQREAERGSQVTTDVVIERADNMATRVFAIGVMVALILAIVTTVLGVVLGLSNLIASLVHWDGASVWIPTLLFLVIMLPFALVTSLDRRYGDRWTADSRWRRISTKLFSFFNWIGIGRSNNRIMALLASHGGDRKVMALTSMIMGSAIVLVMFGYFGMRNSTLFGNYGFFPAGARVALQSGHYDDQRDTKRDPAVPFIESMIADGSYLKLVLPYEPRRDGPAMQERCHLKGTARIQINAQLLACLQTLHPVTLDGKPLTGLRYDIASDARTDRPALLAMIDIRALPNGRHELRIGRPPLPDAPSDPEDDVAARHAKDDIIAFWK